MELEGVEILAEGLDFPEGPLALDDGSIAVVEMLGGRLTRIAPDGHVDVLAAIPGGPNGAALGPDGAVYVCNNGGLGHPRTGRPCIQRVDLVDGSVESVYTECDGQPFAAPNDLVFDSVGGFWFTDLGGNAIYYALADGSRIIRAVSGVRGPNGIGLSPDGEVLFWAQTHTRQVHRRHLTGPGQVKAAPRFDVVTLMRGEALDRWSLVVGLPGAQELDSMAVEEDGRVCVGTLLESGITVVDPTDGSYERYTLPEGLYDGAVTNICFGGPDLQDAFVTCSLTGRLLACRWPRPGLCLAYQRRHLQP